MQLGMIGLGRMGSNMVRRLMQAGHECVVFDVSPAAVDAVGAEGAIAASSVADLAVRLEAPRAVWIMVPAAFTASVVDELLPALQRGDVVVDGGNSHYRHAVDRAAALERSGIFYVDAGTSGGVFGRDRGYCLMVGGALEAVRALEPVLSALAPGFDAAVRTPGRAGPPSPAEHGWLHCGPPGAGHFVKMVHNGIEYGIMAAYAEGLAILEKADAGSQDRADDAETAPLAQPEYYRFDIDIGEVAEVWRRGSVISSWLLDLTAAALRKDPRLDGFSGRVSDSGEGRWTVIAAVEEGVPANVISTALYERFSSRGEGDFADRVLSAMRKEFGGHEEKR